MSIALDSRFKEVVGGDRRVEPPNLNTIARQIAEEEGLTGFANNYFADNKPSPKTTVWGDYGLVGHLDKKLIRKNRRIGELERGIKNYVAAVQDSMLCEEGPDQTASAFQHLIELVWKGESE